MFFNQFAKIIEYCQIKNVNQNDYSHKSLKEKEQEYSSSLVSVSYYIYVFLHMKIGAGARAYKTGSMDIPSRTIYLEKYDETLQKSIQIYSMCQKQMRK